VIAIYAHGFGATNGLPLPRWLLAYSIGFAVVLAFIVLRFIRPPKRPPGPGAQTRDTAPDHAARGPSAGTNGHAATRHQAAHVVARVVGLLLLLGTFVAAAFGVDDSGANIAPVTVIVLFFLGMQVASLLLGDVFWWFKPFDTLAGLFFRRDRDGGDDVEAPTWTAAALLLSFIWFVFAYPEFYPPTPHEVAVFLALYTAAVLAGAAYWGRSWVRHGEGFGALFGAIAQLGRTREPGAGPGLAPLLVVYLGGTLFDGISQTNWWIDVLGTSRGWTERAINTVGLVWSVAIVAVAYLAATRIVAAVADRGPADTARLFAPVLLPVGLAWSVAHYVSAFLLDVQNFYALLSDPLGKGWDVFGTIDYAVNQQVLTPTQTGVLQSVVVGGGCIWGAVIAHDIAFAHYRGRTAVRATYPFVVFLIGSAVAAIWLLLGV
jgi:hypothetical protein